MTRPTKNRIVTLAVWTLGLGLGAALTWHSAPLRALQRQNPDEIFLFADAKCPFSRIALKHIERSETSAAVIPLSYLDSEWADRHCRSSLDRLGGLSRLLWRDLLPSGFACERLVAEARGWHSVHVEGGAIPAWARGDTWQGSGLRSEVLAPLGIPDVPADLAP